MSEKEPPATPRSKLETLAREDLIRFAKKQAITCKQLRERSEELEKKLALVEQSFERKNNDQGCQTVSTAPEEEVQWLRMALNSVTKLQEAPDDDHLTQSTVQARSTGTAPTTADVSCQTIDQQVAVTALTTSQPSTEQRTLDNTNHERLRTVNNELEEARRQLSNQSLEMEDADRSLAKLQTELRQTVELLNSKQSENAILLNELSMLRGRVQTSETERRQLEQRSAEMEQSLLADRSEMKRKESAAKNCESKLGEAMAELERLKLETADGVSSSQRELSELRSALNECKISLDSSESKRASLEEQLEQISSEFRAYKTRVRSVLNQKSNNGGGDEKEKEAVADRLTVVQEQLEKTRQLYEASRTELDRVRDQHEQLFQRHRQTKTEADECEARLKDELQTARAEITKMSRLHTEQIRALASDKLQLQKDFERQLETSSKEHSERVADLENRVAELQRELAAMKQSDQSTAPFPPEPEHTGFRRSPSFLPLAERKPGEGAENAPVITNRWSVDEHPPFDRQHSLEDLLSDQQSLRGSTDQSHVKDDKTTRIIHLTELLSESEANSCRLSEQIKLLKEEIRRLERNLERDGHVANAEYLKNVIVQFLNPALKDQKPQLLPVLATLLRLSPDEVQVLKSTIITDNVPNASGSSSWGGYLHRWSGLM